MRTVKSKTHNVGQCNDLIVATSKALFDEWLGKNLVETLLIVLGDPR